MENRDYLKQFGEDCTANVRCEDCDQKEKCKQDIEQEYGIVIPAV